MGSPTYDFAEELVLAASVAPDSPTPCDLLGCDRVATHLVPGAALCDPCAQECGIGSDSYEVPLERLVGGEEWRQARWSEYVEALVTLRELGGARGRTPQDDLTVARLFRYRVERLIRSVSALTSGGS
jgi:hypothetical protein